MKNILVAIIIAGITLSACKKNSFITGNANVTTSVDSLHFDTLFTSTGSVTKLFRIFNQNDQKLRIDEVSLGGGSASVFKINVDGFNGPTVSNLEVEANDSLYVFVTVKIDPSVANLPFVIQDSVGIRFNNQQQWVQLDAWGQNANFIRSAYINGDETWTNDLPYVILGGMQVAENVTLTLEKGTRVYLHADAPILIDGTLQANGGADDKDKVIFRSDRLDEPYKNYPSAWPGIFFRNKSINNQLKFTEIRNSYQGVVVDHPASNGQPKLTLKETIIDNCFDAGLMAINSSVKAENCLISNCGKNLVLVQGGNYSFTHCTVASYSNSYIQHKDPVLAVTDFYKQGNNTVTADLHANFVNSIFWGDNGNVDNEVIAQKQGSGVFDLSFTNCLLKVKTNPANTTLTNVILNQPPAFELIETQKKLYNFRLKDESPALNKGMATGITIDLDGKPRPVGLPDLGSFEKQ
ncbi:hypothetical protein HHL16_05570 [Pseudoflavitalea sp. G-6-1-2]|uniref:choice-of-anchor Q domain-containing protein n=1 Tax=Pseudoflavitalea sp. G-6-1-2 TaxID=2728841 RepID=UPI00146AF949|nr:choice-of-anchor Q domain-containing protein [Pseudoflavitalea sp. G-6-1-2]NML20330.1 hypothetical protein [Pseudoflavitalea sp. G-6-1-2]